VIRNFLASAIAILLFGPAFASAFEVGYSVPTSDPSLMPFSYYMVETTNAPYEITPLKIQVKLPDTLTGEEQNFFILPDKREPGWWYGNGVRGMCSLKDVVITCNLRFDSVKVDLRKVREKLRSYNLSYGEIEARVRLSAKFASELIGTLRIVLPNFYVETMRSSGFFFL